MIAQDINGYLASVLCSDDKGGQVTCEQADKIPPTHRKNSGKTCGNERERVSSLLSLTHPKLPSGWLHQPRLPPFPDLLAQ